MARYLSLPVLLLAAALSASFVPQFVSFSTSLLGEIGLPLPRMQSQIQLVMLLVLAFSLRSDLETAFVWALVGGILTDMHAALPLGASAAALCVIAYAGSNVARQLYRIRIVTVLLMALTASAAYLAFNYIALLLLGFRYDALLFIQMVALPTALLNAVAALPVYAIVRLLQRRLGMGASGAGASMPREPMAGNSS